MGGCTAKCSVGSSTRWHRSGLVSDRVLKSARDADPYRFKSDCNMQGRDSPTDQAHEKLTHYQEVYVTQSDCDARSPGGRNVDRLSSLVMAHYCAIHTCGGILFYLEGMCVLLSSTSAQSPTASFYIGSSWETWSALCTQIQSCTYARHPT